VVDWHDINWGWEAKISEEESTGRPALRKKFRPNEADADLLCSVQISGNVSERPHFQLALVLLIAAA
jgi:hypothetical protein